MRDITGNILHTATFIATTVVVPSLGPELDHFLDMWGFERDVIRQLADTWNRTTNKLAFVQEMIRLGMGHGEASYFWEEIDAINGVQGERALSVLR